MSDEKQVYPDGSVLIDTTPTATQPNEPEDNATESDPKAITPTDYKATVTIEDDLFKPSTPDSIKGPKLSMLYTTGAGFKEFTERTSDAKNHYTIAWAAAIQNAATTGVFEDGLEGLMERESDWAQHVEVDGVKLRAGKPGIAKSNSGNKLIGQQAISRITALTSAGTIVKIPLWHSGIWVSIKAPQLSAWV